MYQTIRSGQAVGYCYNPLPRPNTTLFEQEFVNKKIFTSSSAKCVSESYITSKRVVLSGTCANEQLCIYMSDLSGANITMGSKRLSPNDFARDQAGQLCLNYLEPRTQ